VSDQQVDHKHDQQNTADADAAAISPPGIAETAAEEEDQYKNNQDQVQSVPPLMVLPNWGDRLTAKPTVTRPLERDLVGHVFASVAIRHARPQDDSD